MAIDPTALNPQEVVVLVVVLGGLVPVFAYNRRLTSWFFLAYGFLLFGALLTNLEHFVWTGILNFLEHSIANLGVGVAFAALAYAARQKRLDSGGENSHLEGG